MMSRFAGLIRVLINKVHFGILRIGNRNIACKGKCTSRLDNEWAVSKGAEVKLGYHFASLQGCRFLVRSGCLEIGNNVGLNSNCIIACHKSIVISDGVEIGPNVCIYDHDHDFRVEGGKATGKYRCSPVVIGDNVWIGANSVILRGTTIGENTVIAAGSVVSGDIPANSVFVQKKEKTIMPI